MTGMGYEGMRERSQSRWGSDRQLELLPADKGLMQTKVKAAFNSLPISLTTGSLYFFLQLKGPCTKYKLKTTFFSSYDAKYKNEEINTFSSVTMQLSREGEKVSAVIIFQQNKDNKI